MNAINLNEYFPMSNLNNVKSIVFESRSNMSRIQEVDAEMQVNDLASRYENAIMNQNEDADRAAYYNFAGELIAKLKKMSSKSMARKFEKIFGFTGCFNVFNVDADERHEMFVNLYNHMMKLQFGSYIPVQGASMMKSAMMSIMTVARQSGRFDDKQIADMRIQHLMNISYRKIGAKYGVSGDMIRSICIGESYKNVHPELIDG